MAAAAGLTGARTLREANPWLLRRDGARGASEATRKKVLFHVEHSRDAGAARKRAR